MSESELALRRLSEDSTIVRTQSRPPVIWIWAAVLSIVVVIVAVIFWLLTLVPGDIVPDSARRIPDLTGATQQSAMQTLTGLDLIVEVRQENDPEVESGLVLRTDPEAGINVTVGSTIVLYVSLGPEMAGVPTGVVNISVEEATAALTQAGFTVGTTTTEHSATVPANAVISTSPGPGEQAPKGSTVDLIVSDGSVEAPDVLGQTVEVATQMLQAPGVQLSVRPQANPGCAQSAGTPVVSQSLVGVVPQNSEVVITYCSG